MPRPSQALAVRFYQRACTDHEEVGDTLLERLFCFPSVRNPWCSLARRCLTLWRCMHLTVFPWPACVLTLSCLVNYLVKGGSHCSLFVRRWDGNISLACLTRKRLASFSLLWNDL
ncbi:hypothetical protein LY78DRAFT_287964 [Colletotrichum sublineola]|nr:hypothetical protein LY78DRAFT_287964 [Colletotrichum sublineola]